MLMLACNKVPYDVIAAQFNLPRKTVARAICAERQRRFRERRRR